MKWPRWRLQPSKSFFGESVATDEDIRRLFEFCLGRTPDIKSIAEKRGLRLGDLAVRLLRSREFLHQVLPSLGTPEDRLLALPSQKLDELREYASRCLAEPIEKDASQAALLLHLLTHKNSTLKKLLEESSAADANAVLSGLRAQPRLTNEQPPSTPLFGKPWDNAATTEDVTQLFRLCLGRSPNEMTLETKRGLPVASILISLLESTEFHKKIRPRLGARSSKLLRLARDDARELGNYLDTKFGPYTPAASELSPAGQLALVLQAVSPLLRERLMSRNIDLLILEDELAQVPKVSPNHAPISKDLVHALYVLFLARLPNHKDNVANAMGAGERDLCFRLLYSEDYSDAQLFPLLVGEKLPNEVMPGPPPKQALDSLATMETISPTTKSKLSSVASWPSLLRLVLADEQFQASHFHPHPHDVSAFRRDLMLRFAKRSTQEGAQELVYGVERLADHVLRLTTRDLPGDSLIGLTHAATEFTLSASSLKPSTTTNCFDLQLATDFDTPRLRALYIQVFDATGGLLQHPTPFTLGPLDSTIDGWLRKAREKLRQGNPIEAEELVSRAVVERPNARDQLYHARLVALNGDLSQALCSVESIELGQMKREARFVRAGLRVSLGTAQGCADEFLACANQNYQTKLSTLLSSALRAIEQDASKGSQTALNWLLGAVLTRAETDPTDLAAAVSSSATPETPRLVVEACFACFVQPQTIWTLLEAFDEVRSALILELSTNGRLELLTPTLATAPPLQITHPSAALYIAKYLEALGNLDGAAQFALRAVALAPTPETKKLGSLILQKAGRIELAAQVLAEALISLPDDVKSWQRLGKLERQLEVQDPTRSTAGLRLATMRLFDICAQRLATRPNDDDARLLLAQTLSLTDRWSEARELLIALHDRASRAELKSSCKLQLAQLCEKLALVTETERWARDAQALTPTVKGAILLAKSLRAQDRCDEAQTVLDAFGDDDNLELLREQPRNLFYQGRFAQAARRSRDNLRRRPRDAHLLLYAAASELEAGDPAAALLLAAQIEATAESTIFQQDLKLLLFDLHERAGSHSLALGAMNDLFASMGCQEVELAENPNLHFFDRLQGTDVYRKGHVVCPPVFEGPTVSVIMTAYNAEAHITTAVRSLLTQSYKNIELIVVDDASTDDTPLILQQLAEDDPRVRLVLKTENSGTYISKNIGLLHATGELVALQDSDDWSHPDRLAKVVAFLMLRPDVVGLTTDWIRMSNDGKLIIKAGIQISHVCCISLVFWREKVLKTLGFFDSVRIEADMEYIRRMRLLFGANAVPRLRWPLLFGRYHAESLTSNSDYGITRTGYTPPRLEYQAEQRKWHASLTQGESAFMPFPLERRRFVAPEVMLPDRNGCDS